jgi:hypothetical protein
MLLPSLDSNGKEMKHSNGKIISILKTRKVRTDTAMGKDVGSGFAEFIYAYEFPPLLKCKELLNYKFKVNYDWQDIDEWDKIPNPLTDYPW